MTILTLLIVWLTPLSPSGGIDRSQSPLAVIGADAQGLGIKDLAISATRPLLDGTDQGASVGSQADEEEDSQDDDPLTQGNSYALALGNCGQAELIAHARPPSVDILSASYPTPLRC